MSQVQENISSQDPFQIQQQQEEISYEQSQIPQGFYMRHTNLLNKVRNNLVRGKFEMHSRLNQIQNSNYSSYNPESIRKQEIHSRVSNNYMSSVEQNRKQEKHSNVQHYKHSVEQNRKFEKHSCAQQYNSNKSNIDYDYEPYLHTLNTQLTDQQILQIEYQHQELLKKKQQGQTKNNQREQQQEDLGAYDRFILNFKESIIFNQSQQQLMEELKFYQQCLVLSITMFGIDHYTAAFIYQCIANIYKSLNNYIEAKKYFELRYQVQSSYRGTFNNDYDAVNYYTFCLLDCQFKLKSNVQIHQIFFLQLLAFSYFQQEFYKQAQGSAQQSLKLIKQILGPQDQIYKDAREFVQFIENQIWKRSI